MSYLSHVSCGWCIVRIGNFAGHASYLTDIPFDILDSILLLIKYGQTPIIHFDEEGSRFYIVIDEYYVDVISSRDERELYTFEVDRRGFILDIVNDIYNNIDAFAAFTYDEWPTSEKRKKKLLKKIAKIREFVKDKNYL